MIYSGKGLLRITKKRFDPGAGREQHFDDDALHAAYLQWQWKLRKMRMNRMAFRDHKSQKF